MVVTPPQGGARGVATMEVTVGWATVMVLEVSGSGPCGLVVGAGLQ